MRRNLTRNNHYPMKKQECMHMKLKKDIKKMNKTELVKLATNKIKEDHSDFNPSLFLRIQAFQDKHGRFVKFSNPVEYVPKNACYYYEAMMRFGNQEFSSLQTASNPDDFDVVEPQFYRMSREDEMHVQEVLKVMEMPVPREFLPETSMIIFERDFGYDVTLKTESEKTFFTLDKKTGEIQETLHEELAQHDDDCCTEITK